MSPARQVGAQDIYHGEADFGCRCTDWLQAIQPDDDEPIVRALPSLQFVVEIDQADNQDKCQSRGGALLDISYAFDD